MVFEAEEISWPGWDVVGKLGEGSFGGVYEIQRNLPDGTVERAALKKLTVPKDPGEIAELYDQSYDSASITAHFREQMQYLVREYAFMQKLGENPNVVHCQDLRTIQHEDGIGWDIYIRMELLQPLKKWIGDQYDERQVIRLGLNLCGALNGCHQRNIIHRDIKPENILVTDDGKYKLGDFGIAKVSEKTATGTLTGTYSYMAPEVANRQHYGASADIYSLGLVMYWMMNERTLPFLPLSKKIPSGLQRQEAQDRRFSGEEIPAPLNGSLELTRIVLKACAFNPEDRYHSVQELAEDLKRHYQTMYHGTVHKPGSSKKASIVPPTSDTSEDTVADAVNVGAFFEQNEQSVIEERHNYWWLSLIAGIVLMILAVVGLGISISVLTQRGRLESAEMVHTPQPSTVETAQAPMAAESQTTLPAESEVAETTLPPETEPVKIHVMAEAEDLTSVDWDKRAEQPFWGQTKYLRSDVKSMTFRGTLDAAPDNAWDVSEAKDGSILAWMESGNLIMAADGKIAPNPNASCLFAYFENANAIDFGNCFDTSKVTDMSFMFSYCSSLRELDVSGFDTSKVTDMRYMFSECSSLTELDVSGFDTSMVTEMGSMFCGCSSLTELDLSGFDTSMVTEMNWTFRNCSSLTKLDVSNFDTSEVTDMGFMFSYCSRLRDLDVSSFDTSGVTDMGNMFYQCSSLTELDVSGFDTSKVTNMGWMFYDCNNLTYLDVSSFDTSGVSDMEAMFQGCSSLTDLDVSSFDTSEVTDIGFMFYGCSSLTELDVSGFDTSKVTNMERMFSGCSSLDSIQCTNSRILDEYSKYSRR